MSKIDPFVRILTFIIENSFPRCMNVEVQLPPGCAFWMFLCSISFAFTSLRADISVLLPNACVREIFGDSCSICESRTHMTSKNRWFFVIFCKFCENLGFAMFVIVQVDWRGRSRHTFWAHSGGDSAVPCRSARHNAFKNHWKRSKIMQKRWKTRRNHRKPIQRPPSLRINPNTANSTIAGAMRVVLPPHSAAGAKEMYAALSSLDFDLLVEF